MLSAEMGGQEFKPLCSPWNVSEPATCKSKDFVCANGECVSARFRCDGDKDCGDNSDEVRTQHQIGTLTIGMGCYSKVACFFFLLSLQKGCETHSCPEDQYQCFNLLCISRKWLCDGQEDCKMGEDEKNCQEPGISYGLPIFRIATGYSLFVSGLRSINHIRIVF